MTRDEALRKAQVALGCHVERDDGEREWCNHPDHKHCPPLWWHVTDLLLDVDREARAGLHCGTLADHGTTEQRVAEAIQRQHGCRREVDMNGAAFCSRHYYGWLSVDRCPHAEAAAVAALNAVREALTSDDPKVLRAMAERVGLDVTWRYRDLDERAVRALRDELDAWLARPKVGPKRGAR